MDRVLQRARTPSSSPTSTGTVFRFLPEDLLERVFCFLPVPNVFLYRLACKRWNVLLRSHQFLLSFDGQNQNLEQKWITVFDGLGFLDERSLLLYDPSLQKWRCISLAFLPSQFDIAIAAAGGLFCVASKTADDQNAMCICNPFTKAYKELPSLQLDLVEPHAIMERKDNSSYKVYVMSSGFMAVYDSNNGYWVNLNIGQPVRPRSPVICGGAIYGLCDEGSLWWQSWKLVSSNLGTLFMTVDSLTNGGLYAGSCNWAVLNQSEWGEIPALIRRPRLLGANGCLLLIGGLKKSVLSYSCSTFIIFKFDFMALEWLEIARMPQDLYWAFQDIASVKIFGSTQDVFFFCEGSHTMVVCSLSTGQVWHKIVDCPHLKYCISDLCKGFTFDLKLGSVVQL